MAQAGQLTEQATRFASNQMQRMDCELGVEANAAHAAKVLLIMLPRLLKTPLTKVAGRLGVRVVRRSPQPLFFESVPLRPLHPSHVNHVNPVNPSCLAIHQRPDCHSCQLSLQHSLRPHPPRIYLHYVTYRVTDPASGEAPASPRWELRGSCSLRIQLFSTNFASRWLGPCSGPLQPSECPSTLSPA